MIKKFETPTVFGNKIPREGTETLALAMIDDIVTAFGNKIPREGTETVIFFLIIEILTLSHLEIRYPERGRH